MRSADSASGTDLLGMLAAGTDWLEQYAFYIDSLNVFPVPDGDTGTNMLLSMRSALEEARSVSKNSASAVAEAFARGALVGARGNSGIILSQFWQGLAQGINGKKLIRAADLAMSMQKAAVLAFQALSKPVEGTILTVIKDIAAATRSESVSKDDLVTFMERVAGAARESVARSPLQLQVLREAGVVDAGGQGLQIILEGALAYFRSDREDFQQHNLPPPTGSPAGNVPKMTVSDGMSYGCCTEFMLRGNDLDPDKIRAVLENRGESLVVAGNRTMVRVHLHTPEPGSIVRYVRSLGQVDHINIRDMDDQHEAFLQGRAETPTEGTVAAIALVPGEGLAAVFSSLGAGTVIIDEQNINQGLEDLREAIDALHDRRVLVLPNSKYLLPGVERIRKSVPEQVTLVPAQTIPQGISAVLAFNPEEDTETNTRLMEAAIKQVHSIEILSAARYSGLEGIEHIDAQVVGLLEGELAAGGEDARKVLEKVMVRLNIDNAELITIYYGDAVRDDAVEAVCSSVHHNYPHLEVEKISGGRFLSDFIISIE